MKTAYINATLLNKHHDAFIVEDERFMMVGRKAKILNQTVDQIIDLNHDYILPGFNDSHMHLLGIGKSMHMEDVAKFRSIDEIVAHLKPIKKPFILGRGFHESNVREMRPLTKDDLDQVSQEIPIIIYRVCGHMVMANSKAIEQAIALHGKKDSISEGYDLEQGIFKEDAIHYVLDILPPVSKKQIKEEILMAQEYLIASGITAIGSDDFSMYKIDYETILEAFKELDASGALKLSVLEQVNLPSIDTFKDYLQKGYANQKGRRFDLGPLKLLADGSLGANSAYVSEAYKDYDTLGISVFSEAKLMEYFKLCHAHEMDFAIHAIGDQCVEDILTALENVSDETLRNKRRHSIIHAQLARLDQIAKMKALNVGAQTQPIFINSDFAILEKKLGKARMQNSYLFNTMYQSGILTTISTDAPVEDVNPFENLYVATTRKSIKNPELGVFNKGECFTVEDAVDAYTYQGARLMYKENELGKIDSGYFADFIRVKGFDPDNSNSFLDSVVLETFIHGETVYKKERD